MRGHADCVQQGGVTYLEGGTFIAEHCSFSNNKAVRAKACTRAMRVLGRDCDTGAVTTSRVCTLSDGCDACVYRCVIDVALVLVRSWAGVARFRLYVTGARCLCLVVAATQVQ